MKLTDEIKNHLENAEFDEALTAFKALVDKTKYEATYTSISAKYQLYKDGIINNTTKLEERSIEISRIIFSIYNTVSELEKAEIRKEKNINLGQLTSSQFIENLNFYDISELIIIGHVGRKLVTELYNRMDSFSDIFIKNPDLNIKILLRSPYSENQERYRYLFDSIDYIRKITSKYITIDVRFYDSIPYCRAIIAKYKDSTIDSFISFYNWLPRLNTKAFHYSFILERFNSISENRYFNLVLSWFEHYWGINELHTIIFDFDDTLINSLDIQVSAWLAAIKTFLGKKKIDGTCLLPELLEAIQSSNDYFAKKVIKEIFHQKQLAPQILTSLIPGFPDDNTLKQEFEVIRFNQRKNFTLNEACLFSGVEQTLDYLSRQYQLVIVSATSESLINDILVKKKIRHYFSMILGKYGPKSDWENIFDKANLVIKLSKLTGIGIERMVYIGDNNSDYQSTRQINLKFIECRVLAELQNYKSNVKYTTPEEEMFFISYENDKLQKLLDTINLEISSEKYSLNLDYLPK